MRGLTDIEAEILTACVASSTSIEEVLVDPSNAMRAPGEWFPALARLLFERRIARVYANGTFSIYETTARGKQALSLHVAAKVFGGPR